MPLFSAFTSFGFFEFSSEPSEHEKIYNALITSYIDPRTGRPAIDISEGTHQEGKIFGWAGALGGARVNLRRAGNDLHGETSYATLEAHEAKHQMSPAATDTVPMRRAALAAKQKAARGPRYEAVVEGLSAILGTNLVAYRPINTTEAVAYPATLESSPGIFRRADTVAKSVRLLTAVTRCVRYAIDSYSESNQSASTTLQDTAGMDVSAISQSFVGNGYPIVECVWYLKKTGAPPGNITAKIFAVNGSNHPTGTALATATARSASSLTTSYALTSFEFPANAQMVTESGVTYATVLGYSAGSGGNNVQAGSDSSAPSHSGTPSAYFAGLWNGAANDFCFYVNADPSMQVSYENWNRSLVEQVIVPGDILCVDPGNYGLVERVTVTESAGSGTSRTFSALFTQPHSVGCYATDGPVPLWANTKRHVLVVVKAAAAIDATIVRSINDLFKRVMRGPTTWAIVQPTTPGAVTVGPFKIGDTLGSPLGAVPVESITL